MYYVFISELGCSIESDLTLSNFPCKAYFELIFTRLQLIIPNECHRLSILILYDVITRFPSFPSVYGIFHLIISI